MNNKRREFLKVADKALEGVYFSINTALDEEIDCFDNIPENLQESEAAEKIDLAIDSLQEAVDYIDMARDKIGEAVE